MEGKGTERCQVRQGLGSVVGTQKVNSVLN